MNRMLWIAHALVAGVSVVAAAQTSTPLPTTDPTSLGRDAPLPPAPGSSSGSVLKSANPSVLLPTAPQLPTGVLGAGSSASGVPLTLTEAEQMAIAHNPRVTIANLLALAQGQQTREQRAAELPTLTANLTAVGADNGTRITAGALNNPVLYQRAAAGVTLSQLITDFGRTRNLVASANLRAVAAQSTLAATRNDIIFAVDEAFYRALGAQALIQVAAQTVNARQATSNQVQALANARLRSTLDLSFANAQLAQAQLLLLDARNQSASAQADLVALLGTTGTLYLLIDQSPAIPAPVPESPDSLLKQAYAQRPDLASLQQDAQAEHRFARAEHDLLLPSVSALGTTGDAPVHAGQITSDVYGAVGVNVNIPIFNGFLYSARTREASLRASAADARVEELRNNIARDVTTTVLQAQDNYSRIAVAEQLAAQANSALSLAQTRYQLGLSSIVELSQAQLLQMQAQIELADARYAYEGSLSAIRYQTGQ